MWMMWVEAFDRNNILNIIMVNKSDGMCILGVMFVWEKV